MKYICYLDFETGGLDPHEGAEPIELAAIMLDENLVEVSRFPARLMRVEKPENLAPGALKVNGKTVEQIMAAEDPKTVFTDFVNWVAGYIPAEDLALPAYKRRRVVPAGHNVPFDIGFLKVALKKYLPRDVYDQIFDYHALCTFALGYPYKVLITGEMKKGSLTNFTEHYGIPHAAHEAMGDVEAGVELMRILFDELRGGYAARRNQESIAKTAIMRSV